MKTLTAKTLFASLAAVAAVTAAAAPAAAQPYRHDDRGSDSRGYEDRGYDTRGYGQRDSARVATAERRIDQGLRNRELTPREARQLQDEVRDYARLESSLRRGGLTSREGAVLERRWDRLIQAIKHETRDRDYGHGYGYRR